MHSKRSWEGRRKEGCDGRTYDEHDPAAAPRTESLGDVRRSIAPPGTRERLPPPVENSGGVLGICKSESTEGEGVNAGVDRSDDVFPGAATWSGASGSLVCDTHGVP
jgi:hypothetical protein